MDLILIIDSKTPVGLVLSILQDKGVRKNSNRYDFNPYQTEKFRGVVALTSSMTLYTMVKYTFTPFPSLFFLSSLSLLSFRKMII